MIRRSVAIVSLLFAVLLAAQAHGFSYNPAGTLVSGSGSGRADSTVHLAGMRFPMEAAPAWLNSQVYAPGGSRGGGGGQCDSANYSYPWWDNYCESRSWTNPLCPAGVGHQGQDMRAATCTDNVHWVVAGENGTISHIGTYSVYLQGASGIRHRYLHMKVSSIAVSVGQTVVKGQRLGRVSNAFGATSTTVHLHYDMYRWVSGYGSVYVTPYMSLVRGYETLLGLGPTEQDPAACVPAAVAGAENELFKDMPPGSLAKANAEALYRAGITNGCSQSPRLFCPDCPTTRYMMVIFLVKAAGIDFSNPPTTPSFADVPTTAWYYPHVEAAKAAGITQGCGSGNFCPNAVVTRGMAAAFIVNTTGWPRLNPATPSYADVSTGAWYYRSVETIKDWCITNGCGGGNYCPDNTLTRAQAAAFIARAFDLENANACVQYCDPSTCNGGSGCEEEWTECGGFSDVCDEGGVQTRGCNDLVCTGTLKVQSCDATPRTESRSCSRDTDGVLVAGWGSWSDCGGFTDSCDPDGTQVRTRTTCAGGSATDQTEERACTRVVSCGGTDGGSDGGGAADGNDGTGDVGPDADAGLEEDAGGGSPITASGGCGCEAAAGGGLEGLLILPLLALFMRRRTVCASSTGSTGSSQATRRTSSYLPALGAASCQLTGPARWCVVVVPFAGDLGA